MKAFVTGGTGFIGGALVKKLMDSGYDVMCLVRSGSDFTKLKELGAKIVVGDIRRRDSMAHPISQCDVVFHLAAWYEFGVWNTRKMFETNVVGTCNVLELALENKKKVVYCSTAGILGYSENSPKNESSKRSEVFTSEYERTKYLAHVEAMKFADRGLELVTVMPGAVFGPGDTSLVGYLLGRYTQGKLRYFIKMTLKFSWVHVDDIIDGFLLVEKKGKIGDAYILSDRVLTMLEFLKRAEEFTGIQPPKRLIGVRTASLIAPFSELSSKLRRRKAALSREAVVMLKHNWIWDSSKARRELGWMPKDFDMRLKDTMGWYVNRHISQGKSRD